MFLRKGKEAVRKLLISVIKIYQIILSPLLGDCCRFYPSCSAYCIAAIRTHGCIKGLWLGLLRVSRCHPLNPGGVDFVPGTVNQNTGNHE